MVISLEKANNLVLHDGWGCDSVPVSRCVVLKGLLTAAAVVVFLMLMFRIFGKSGGRAVNRRNEQRRRLQSSAATRPHRCTNCIVLMRKVELSQSSMSQCVYSLCIEISFFSFGAAEMGLSNYQSLTAM